MSVIKNHRRLEEMLIRHEGLRLKPYRDSVGKLTIGIGRNLDDVGISKQEALYLLGHDIDRAISDCINQLPWFGGLDNVRKDVIINMVFNLGITRFKKFRRLNIALEVRDFSWACYEMLDSKWAKQVKGRAIELAKMMRYGVYE